MADASVVVRQAAGLDLAEEARCVLALDPELLPALAVDDHRQAIAAGDLPGAGERRAQFLGTGDVLAAPAEGLGHAVIAQILLEKMDGRAVRVLGLRIPGAPAVVVIEDHDD